MTVGEDRYNMFLGDGVDYASTSRISAIAVRDASSNTRGT